MNQFRYSILYVKDVKATISFYEQAFGFERIFISPDNQYGELDGFLIEICTPME